MLTVDFKNALSEKLKGEGLSKKEFQELQRKYQSIKSVLTQKKQLGFIDLPYQKSTHLELLEAEAKKIRKNFQNVFIIGIGGSSLGSIALMKSLKPFQTEQPHLFFLDNPEAGYIDFLIKNVDLSKTLLIVISKSGGTIESLSIFSVLYAQMLKKMGSKAKKNVVTITENNNGPLAKITRKEGFTTFEVPLNVGGRFSVFTNVGLLPAAIAGINIQKLLKGARNTDLEMAYKLSLLQYSLYKEKGKTMTVFFPYGRILADLGDWYVQLLAESIGKNAKVGPTPLKAVGAMDQHAQLQLFMEGPNNKFHIFVEYLKTKQIRIPTLFKNEKPFEYLQGHDLHEVLLTERKGTAEALASKKRPNITFTMEKIDEENLGELMYLLEIEIAFLGELFQINAFDQPGVEISKILTKQYLSKKN
ncbi:MAG: hypothetical protein WC843_01615 [Candidatus Gracilibacteria bacterium]|jgi:glucose-6-phosphate isomerase